MGTSDSSFDNIKVNRWIIAVTEEVKPTTDKTSTISAIPTPPAFLAKFVYIFPSSITPKPKASSPSATPKP